MFSGGEGPWEADPELDGLVGRRPPFHGPIFVVTHHEREPLVLSGHHLNAWSRRVEEDDTAGT